MSVRRFRLCLIAFAALSLVGCFGDDDRSVHALVIGDPASPFAAGADLPLAAQLLRGASMEGLVGFDEQGHVVPALADRWIVTDDGLSYIFRLRDGTWPGGREITADSARIALQGAIARQRGQPFFADLAVIEDVRAMAGRVIEIRLRQQMPDMLQLLAQPELGLIVGGRGAGPMTARRSTGKQTGLAGVLLKAIPPEDRGLPSEEGWKDHVQQVRLTAVPATKALELFANGQAEVVLGGGLADFPRIRTAGISGGAIRLDPVGGLFGLMVLNDRGFLALPENREAIAMAIDRDAIIGALNIAGWTATTRVINPGLQGDNGSVGERWAARSISDRRSAAAARVSHWSKGKAEQPLVRIAMPAGPGADILFERLHQDLGAIGIRTRRVRLSAEADLRLIDQVASYPRANWFFNQLSCAYARALCSKVADGLFVRAQQETDPVKRADLVADAEVQLTLDNTYIPFGIPIRWSLVSGSINGFATNRWAIHPLMPMAFLPK